ncbi:MAG: hypothetical protein ABIH99_04665 [Candidatus Micrarchaeota archaeon]
MADPISALKEGSSLINLGIGAAALGAGVVLAVYVVMTLVGIRRGGEYLKGLAMMLAFVEFMLLFLALFSNYMLIPTGEMMAGVAPHVESRSGEGSANANESVNASAGMRVPEMPKVPK